MKFDFKVTQKALFIDLTMKVGDHFDLLMFFK